MTIAKLFQSLFRFRGRGLLRPRYAAAPVRHGYPRSFSRGLRPVCVAEARRRNVHRMRRYLDPAYRRRTGVEVPADRQPIVNGAEV